MRPALTKIIITSNTLTQLGRTRLTSRLLREIRYHFIYPYLRQTFPEEITIPDNYELPTGYSRFLLESYMPEGALVREAATLGRQTFTFLNLPSVTFPRNIEWQYSPKQDPLWRYNLHYGEWAQTLVHALLFTGEIGYRQALISLMADWLKHNRPGSAPGWEPYPLSRRLVAWSKVALSLKKDEEWRSFWKKSLAPSMHQQTRLLAANLEQDLANNHLIANYRALAWMGLLFPDWPESARWRHMGLTGLWEEMDRQVLPDGVHDERSLSYHALVLTDFLETWHLCKSLRENVPEGIEDKLLLMLRFLSDIRAPDGGYPMLNDTVPGYPPNIPELITCWGNLVKASGQSRHFAEGSHMDTETLSAEVRHNIPMEEEFRPEARAYPEAGYVILTSDDDYLCFDAGPMGPHHLQGHGHADALSFVLYGRGQPLIIDPGVYSYHDKYWRNHFRSTQAHNTVCVDNQDQCVFWGPFRVAYPPKVHLLSWSDMHVEGDHEGYFRLRNPVLHRRRLEKLARGVWELFDRFEGRGEHDFYLTLQFAPQATARQQGRHEYLVDWPGKACLRITIEEAPPDSHSSIEWGWVSYGWNLKVEAPRFVLKWRGSVPLEDRLILQVSDP
jgi:uncharacterized heparinase superfamily protein